MIVARSMDESKLKCLILLVEDGIDSRHFAMEVLEEAGYMVIAVRLGQEAISVASGTQFDLILMDISLPDMTGYEVTSKVRAIDHLHGRPKTPIIALTSHTSQSHRARAMAVGMDAYLTKPIFPEKLLDAVDGLLSRTLGPSILTGQLNGQIGKKAEKENEAQIPFSPLVESYLGRVWEYTETITKDTGAGDWEPVRIIGHNLKGTGGTYGFPRLSVLGGQLELAAASRNQLLTASTTAELKAWLESIWKR